MDRRPPARTRRAALRGMGALAVGLGSLGLAGCDPRMALYFLQPFEPKIKAPCPPLKGKRVVILAEAAGTARNEFVSIDRELAKELATLLRKNVKRIDVVDTEEVAAWAQAKPVTDPAQAAKAFEADIVIFLSINEFRVQDPSSPELFEGRSSIDIRVVELAHPKDDRGREIADRPKVASTIYEGERSTQFPVTGHIPTSPNVSRSAFKSRFLKLVANEVSWNFIDHAPGDNIQDTRFE